MLEQTDHLSIDDRDVSQVQVIDGPLIKVFRQHLADFNRALVDYLQDLDSDRGYSTQGEVENANEH